MVRLDTDLFATGLTGLLPDWRGRSHCVALSGGLDSMALLDLMRAAGPARLRACHVDHGLNPASSRWRDFCARHCERLDVPFVALRVAVASDRGVSPEAAARAARYEALGRELAPGEVLHCAHHADDQAETVLLQLLRGGGPAGLAAMPPLIPWEAGWLCRPLLGVHRETLLAYASGRGLRWIEDPSNEQLRPDRNYLRHRVMPLLRARWPGLAATVGRSARHSAAAARLLAERAAEDLALCRAGEALGLVPLRRLSEERQRQVLRHWARVRGLPPPDSRRLGQLLADLVRRRGAGGGQVDWPGAGVRRFRDRLYLLDETSLARLASPPRPAAWRAPEPLALGEGLGTLVAEPARGDGVAAALVDDRSLQIRWRAGGERIRPAPAARRRRLKSLMREAGILPWMRGRVPLVYAGDELVAVGDLWLSADWRAGAGEAGYRILWADRPALD